MAERKRITLIYQYNDNWIGGTYYILNIIKALNFLPNEEKPQLTVIYGKNTDYSLIETINYPFIDFVGADFTFSFVAKAINRISRSVLKKPLIKTILPLAQIDNLYPVSDFISTRNVKNYFYWIPDFQEHYLPDFFSPREISDRRDTQLNIKRLEVPVVFSSNNAKDDFNKFYPGNTNKEAVLKFVSILDPKYAEVELDSLFEKYAITLPYFIVPNQFWKHKNQEVVLKALTLLKETGLQFQVIFTGKEFDHRHPDHIANIKKYVIDNQLSENVSFLGFIDREHQLQLMKNSLAIIQPSLFEGWSTVVEDTKALNHFIILSNIPLHKEQINLNCLFFDPLDEKELASRILETLKGVTIQEQNYRINIIEFAKKFISIF